MHYELKQHKDLKLFLKDKKYFRQGFLIIFCYNLMSLKKHIETRFKLTANPLPKAPCGRGMSHIRPREKKLQSKTIDLGRTDRLITEGRL